jgi:hypothetical protein
VFYPKRKGSEGFIFPRGFVQMTKGLSNPSQSMHLQKGASSGLPYGRPRPTSRMEVVQIASVFERCPKTLDSTPLAFLWGVPILLGSERIETLSFCKRKGSFPGVFH